MDLKIGSEMSVEEKPFGQGIEMHVGKAEMDFRQSNLSDIERNRWE